MNENNQPRTVAWNEDRGEDIEYTKKVILDVFKEQKVSLSKIRYLFEYILGEIEDKNPINF